MVRRKNRIRTNNLRTIRRSIPRFLSLMIMSALGVLVFAGLTATAPDMIASLDEYLDQYHGYDARIVSDMGLTGEDLKAVSEVDGVDLAEAVDQQDVTVTLNDNEKVIRVASVPEKIYSLTLLSGRMPEAADEIVAEENLLSKEGLSLGDSLTLDDDVFVNKTVTIVGTVDSAMYFNSTKTHQSRGSSSVGSGTVNYYAYVPMENFDLDYYTAIYVTGTGLQNLTTSTDSYIEQAEVLTDNLEGIAETREQARYTQLSDEGQDKIDDARSEADEKLADARKKLDEAKTKLSDAKTKLSDGRSALDETKTKLADAKKSIDEGWSAYNSKAAELTAAKEKLAQAKSTIKSKKKDLESAKATLVSSKKKLDANKAKLDSAKKQLDSAEAKLDKAKTALNSAKSQLDSGKTQLSVAKKQLDQGAEALKKAAAQIETAKASLTAQGYTEEQIAAVMSEKEAEYAASQKTYDQSKAAYDKNKAVYDKHKAAYDQKKTVYDKNKASFDSKKASYNKGVTAYRKGKAAYDSGYKKYQSGQKALKKAEASYKEGVTSYKSGKAALQKAKKKLEKSEQEYNSGLQKYESGENEYAKSLSSYKKNLKKYKDAKSEYQDKKAEADEKIEDAQAELDELEQPNWYVYDREDDSNYKDYIQDAESIENLAFLFPVVFYLVAILVSLISMNRMVEDDRLEIGTMKSLGFSDNMIISKYVVFSICATLTGGILGAVLGLYIIPNLIFNIYRILFDLPRLVISFHASTTVLGMVLAVICVCGTSVLTAWQVLKEKPSELMRPKAPKKGKRIFLERIPGIWSRVSFSNKITIRNLARYKKRVLITIGGIVGCTALMLTGFGIKDSIVDLPTAQYGQVFSFDGTAYVSGLKKGEEQQRINEIMEDAGLSTFVATQRLNITLGNLEGYIMAAQDDDAMALAVNLKDIDTGDKLTLADDCVIITDKLADLMNLSVGDEISFQDMDQNLYTCKVGGICVNYVENYVFMTSSMLEKTRSFQPNLVYFHVGSGQNQTADNVNANDDKKESIAETDLMRDTELTEDEKDSLSEKLLSNDEVLTVSYIDNLIENVQNMLKSLDSVVLILVVLSAALSFVVLYNLANININERKREIATLKVLGFFDHEVDSYITKETIFTTLAGIILGLLAGTLLSHLVVMTIEIDLARFINQVKPLSYVYSAAFAVLFTWIVNRIIHFALLRIDMIDSLKSVE